MHQNNNITGLFESFNARALSPAEVAVTFVPPPTFIKVARRNNTIITGPRGSGKTTLLKMLQQSAIESWEDPKINEYLRVIDYTSVFIPTDRRWSLQLKSLNEFVDPETAKLYIRAAFTTHALRRLLASMIDRTKPASDDLIRSFRRVTLSTDDEARIVKEYATAWALSPSLNSFLSLKHSLSQRLSEIRKSAGQGLREQDYLYMPLIESIAYAVEIFNDIVGSPDDRWVLAFDELELAPDFMRSDLVGAIRAADDRLLFKLALSPTSDQSDSLEDAFGVAAGHDFEPIRLWYTERSELLPFCNDLWSAIVKARQDEVLSPVQVLGESYFEQVGKSETDPEKYAPGSKWSEEFIKAYESDSTFRDYLKRVEIDVEDLTIKGVRKAQHIRKVAPLIPLRNFFRTTRDDSRQSERSVNVPTIYAGAKSVFAISEGNPRWFIGLVSGLLDRYDEQNKRVTKPQQARELVNMSQRFEAFVRTIPARESSNLKIDVLGLVKRVATYLHEENVLGDFKPEPASSFYVPESVGSDLIQLIRAATDVGALVYLPDEAGNVMANKVTGKRFRLSYLFAPTHHLPIRLSGTDVSLRTILRDPHPDLFEDLQSTTS